MIDTNGVDRVLSDHDQRYMRLALEEARQARFEGEVPVGAVVVVDGAVAGRGHNASIARVDPTAHAEIVAIRDAAARLGNYRLVGSTVYCTVEPCLMCLGAMIHARVGRLVFGAAEGRVGATEKLESLRGLGADINHRIETSGGVLASEASELLLEFFREKRAEAQAKPVGCAERSEPS
jgi:tRNA(adenine34) deaminase